MTVDDCLKQDSFGLAEILVEAKYIGVNKNYSAPILLNSSASSSFWKEDMSLSGFGRHFTLKSLKNVTQNEEDCLAFILLRNFSFFVFVHDEDFFLYSVNPLGPPSKSWQFQAHEENHYQEVTLTVHKKLNLEHRPCEESEDYSFTTCVKENIAETVGCRMPWDRLSQQDRAICTEREQFRKTDLKATQFMVSEVNEVERATGCLKPCSYKEYKIVNTIPKDLPVANVPADQIAILLSAVTKYTQFEEEVPSVQ